MKKEALFYGKNSNGDLVCGLCAHGCTIKDNSYGICGVRKNENGVLYTLVYGDVIASHVDPIEKKPLYHFLPGTRSYSIATVGCNFKCGFCQNWRISQVPKSGASGDGYELMPAEVVRQAKAHGCKSISYTYTEPTIYFEYALDTAKIAKKNGIYNVFVTNGYMTAQALDTVTPYLDAANVDLKAFTEGFYRDKCKAGLEPVKNTIMRMKEKGIWVEVTTLLIPGENDSDEEISQLAGFIAGIDKGMPWHISRFHPDYQFTDHAYTPVTRLKSAKEIGHQKGLHHVYLGNIMEGNDTLCDKCHELLIRRDYMSSKVMGMDNGKCGSCKNKINGIWG